MPVAITIRNVPDDVRNMLAARAARSGRSLQEFLMRQLVEVAMRPSVDEAVEDARRAAETSGRVLAREEILAARDAERR